MRVLIAGGGVGGLCLAHGLRAAGIEVAVYERDASAAVRNQGYRIHLDHNGVAALRRCLPDNLYQLFAATSHRSRANRLSGVDHQLNEVFAHEFPARPDDPPTAVNRLTLRQVLLTGLGDTVHFGHELAGAEQTATGVTVRFTDGGTADGDLLVGADGINSVVRRGLLPHAEVVDTGLRVVYGRTPVTEERLTWLPERIFQGFTGVAGPKSRSMALGAFVARRPISEAVAEFVPDAVLDLVTDYVMWAAVAPAGAHPLLGDGLFEQQPAALHEIALALVDDWHPSLRRLVGEADVPAVFALSIRTSKRVAAWPTTNVTLLGDAIHAMTPAGGVGANTALRDAALLADVLGAAHRGEVAPRDAVAGYEEQLRDYGFAAVEQSLRQLGGAA